MRDSSLGRKANKIRRLHHPSGSHVFHTLAFPLQLLRDSTQLFFIEGRRIDTPSKNNLRLRWDSPIKQPRSDKYIRVGSYGIATTHIKRQLISGDNSYQFEKATTHIKRYFISIWKKRQLISSLPIGYKYLNFTSRTNY